MCFCAFIFQNLVVNEMFKELINHWFFIQNYKKKCGFDGLLASCTDIVPGLRFVELQARSRWSDLVSILICLFLYKFMQNAILTIYH